MALPFLTVQYCVRSFITDLLIFVQNIEIGLIGSSLNYLVSLALKNADAGNELQNLIKSSLFIVLKHNMQSKVSF